MKLQYYSTEDRQSIIDTYCTGEGYRIAEEHNHGDGDYLILGPPTDYSTIDSEGVWNFDVESWLDDNVRLERTERLTATDYLMLVDIIETMTDEQIEKWKTYGQVLRDFPSTFSGIIEPPVIVWPEAPE